MFSDGHRRRHSSCLSNFWASPWIAPRNFWAYLGHSHAFSCSTSEGHPQGQTNAMPRLPVPSLIRQKSSSLYYKNGKGKVGTVSPRPCRPRRVMFLQADSTVERMGPSHPATTREIPGVLRVDRLRPLSSSGENGSERRRPRRKVPSKEVSGKSGAPPALQDPVWPLPQCLQGSP